MVGIYESQELVKDFRNRFLVDVLQEVLDHGAILVEDEWEKLLLLSTDQKGDELAEVSGKDWVQLLIVGLDEFEESLEQDELVVFFFLFFIVILFWGIGIGHECAGGSDHGGQFGLDCHLSLLLGSFFLLWLSLLLLDWLWSLNYLLLLRLWLLCVLLLWCLDLFFHFWCLFNCLFIGSLLLIGVFFFVLGYLLEVLGCSLFHLNLDWCISCLLVFFCLFFLFLTL
jgi:hypothetical protein